MADMNTMPVFEFSPIYVKLTEHIGTEQPVWSIGNLLSSPVIASLAVIMAALIGGYISYVLYERQKYDRKFEAYLQLASKGGVLVDLYRLLYIKRLYEEKLRLGLEIDKYYLDLSGKDKLAVDSCINESSVFALYKDAKSRRAGLELQIVKNLEQFWTNINQNLVSFSDNDDLNQKVLL